jgi:hypothetical protein
LFPISVFLVAHDPIGPIADVAPKRTLREAVQVGFVIGKRR